MPTGSESWIPARLWSTSGTTTDFWAVILYNDQEAYVAKQYLTAGE